MPKERAHTDIVVFRVLDEQAVRAEFDSHATILSGWMDFLWEEKGKADIYVSPSSEKSRGSGEGRDKTEMQARIRSVY